MNLNERAHRLVDTFAADAARLKISVTMLPGGTRILDCGVGTTGGLEAGLGLARACMADLGGVSLVPGDVAGAALPLVRVATDWPVAACMASQYAGWQVSVGQFFAMGSGPMRAAAGREPLFEKIGHTEKPAVAVGVLETDKLPSEDVARYLAERCAITQDKLTLLAAPTTSIAGAIQVVARSVETALHKLHELGFDLAQIVSAFGTAPLPPVAKKAIAAIGRTNDAILYGGRVTLWVRAEDDRLAEVGPKVPSSASADHGEPFAAVFERYQRDFYKIDPLLFSPAEVTFCNLASGRTHRFGKLKPSVLEQSFFS